MEVNRVQRGWSKPKLHLPVPRKLRAVVGRYRGAGVKLYQRGLGEAQRTGPVLKPLFPGPVATRTAGKAHPSSVARPQHQAVRSRWGAPGSPSSCPTPASRDQATSPASVQRLPTRGTQRQASSSWSAADTRGGRGTLALKRSGSGVPKSP